MPTVHLLDYVAGNVRSLVNAIEKVGYEVAWVKTPEEVANADVCQASKSIPHIVNSIELIRMIETYSSWRRPLRPLPEPALRRWLPPRH